jgi:hypothetical protein
MRNEGVSMNRKHNQDRDSRLYQYYLKHPEMTQDSIASVFDIKTRQQVYSIIKAQKLLALSEENPEEGI